MARRKAVTEEGLSTDGAGIAPNGAADTAPNHDAPEVDMAAPQVDTEAIPGEQGAGGGHWVTPEEAAYTGTPCAGRHRWKGGNVCVRCGAPKPARGTRTPRTTTERAPSLSVRAGAFETMAAMLWGSAGLAVEYRRPLVNHFIKHQEDVEQGKVSGPVGRSLQMEAAIAGRRIDRAFHKASPFWYTIIARFINKATWFTELIPLMVPPTVVGVMAQFPELAERFKPQIMSVMIPIMVEISKYEQQQAELMSKMEGYNARTFEEAETIIDSIIKGASNADTGTGSATAS